MNWFGAVPTPESFASTVPSRRGSEHARKPPTHIALLHHLFANFIRDAAENDRAAKEHRTQLATAATTTSKGRRASGEGHEPLSA
jgi:hypothetical protein